MHSQAITHCYSDFNTVTKPENPRPPDFHTDMFANLLKFDTAFLNIAGQPALRTEARILMLINNNKLSSVKEILSHSHTSSRTFYTLIGKMKNDKMIVSANDHEDFRIKRLQVNCDFLKTITSLLV